MRLLIDMNLSPSWAAALVEAGHEAVHWSRIGAPNASDRQLMDWAAANDHVVVTADLDFSAILAALRTRKPSVIQIRPGLLTPEAIGAKVVETLRTLAADLAGGALVSVDAERARHHVSCGMGIRSSMAAWR
jgi:predicted nuclease of predicted toxin-antitoxin system